jgi:amino-acid N-acetyltransferase
VAEEVEQLHLALVKIRKPQDLDDETLKAIGYTFTQLSRLGLVSVIVVDLGTEHSNHFPEWRSLVEFQADRIVNAIEANQGAARKIHGVFRSQGTIEDSKISVVSRKLLLTPLQRGTIPVITPISYESALQTAEIISGSAAMLALTMELAGLAPEIALDEHHDVVTEKIHTLQQEASLDRLILLDPLGGFPHPKGVHIFVNMEQEYKALSSQLVQYCTNLPDGEAEAHLDNLNLLRTAMSVLPRSSSAILTTPIEAANSGKSPSVDSDANVGTRRRKNPLIHSLLTDKPMISSSLPAGRRNDSLASGGNFKAAQAQTTFVKLGMYVTMIPNTSVHSWVPPQAGESTLSLRDPQVDLPRLVALIEDSFGRELDVDDYLKRIEGRTAGLIIAGDYEGGAILTWETPKSLGLNAPPERLVPYLDKFAVLKRSQGAGGVADIVFNAMVTECFPNGVCWRSRQNNPVNKWYFERARGTWKLPDTNWTMFWTTAGVDSSSETFADYEDVCRNVQPSWANKKIAAD